MHALEGLVVLDLTTGVSGPLATRQLADWGARVIKVERPGGDLSREWDTVCDGISSSHVWLNRNKESVVLDLKRPEAIAAVEKIVRMADVVVENQIPGSVERLGLDYETLRGWKPDIVYCHISGYGDTGPYAEMKAFDMLVQGETGLLEMNGTAEGMAKIPLSICDISSGMYAVAAIQSALLRRARTGEGEDIHLSMFGVTMDLLGYFPYFYWYRGALPRRQGVRHHLIAPYGPYVARDGATVNIAVLSQAHWRLFCSQVLERGDLLEDHRFTDNEARVGHREELEAELCASFEQRSAAEWLERLTAAGIPCGLVNRLDAVLEHTALQHSGMLAQIQSVRGPLRTLGNPIRWSTLENRLDAVPGLGEQTDALFGELGYTAGEVTALRSAGVIK